MNRIDRLLGIILLLQGRRIVTADQIARHFETSVRTVYRDLSALSEIGVPIAAEAGVGYTLLRGYHLPPVMFSLEEAGALFMGGEMVKEFTDSSMANPMESALMKIQAVLPQQQHDQAARILQHTAVFAPGQQAPLLDRKILLPLQRALARHQELRLVYNGKGRPQPENHRRFPRLPHPLRPRCGRGGQPGGGGRSDIVQAGAKSILR